MEKISLSSDLHTHTAFSHGKGSVRDNIEAAIAMGLERIAVTDHAPGHRAYGIRDIDGYFKEIDRLKSEYNGRIEILSGMEFNIMDARANTDYLSDYLPYLDIKLVGYHKLAFAKELSAICYFAFGAKKDVVTNTDIYIKLLQSGLFDIITHPGYALKIDIAEVAKAFAKSNSLLEINNKHNSLSPAELETAASYGAEFIISSDAHLPEAVGKADCAIAAAREAGILSAVRNIKTEGGLAR